MSTRGLALTFALLAGCAPRVTPCGLRLVSGWMTAEELRAAERAVLERGPLTTHEDLQDLSAMCSRLADVTVIPEKETTLSLQVSDGPASGDGEANCREAWVRVASPPEGKWQFGSLAHELMHLLTRCNGHVGWTDTGINQQLINIYFTAVPDPRTP